MSKRITVPICWATYKVPDDVHAIIGQMVTQPPAIVLEAMVAQGKAIREIAFHTIHIDDDESSEEIFQSGIFPDDDDEDDD